MEKKSPESIIDDIKEPTKDMYARTSFDKAIKAQRKITPASIPLYRNKIFDKAISCADSEEGKRLLQWAKFMIGSVEDNLLEPSPFMQDALFFPSKPNLHKLCQYISMAKKSLQVCVFNITNDLISNELIKAHERGCLVKVITDDQSVANSKGGDAPRLAEAGIEVVTDAEPQYHMHNKFVVVDDAFVITGSFNWTFQAANHNQENIVLLHKPYFVQKFLVEFTKLWKQFRTNILSSPMTHDQAATKITREYRAKKQRDVWKKRPQGGKGGYVKKEHPVHHIAPLPKGEGGASAWDADMKLK